MGIDRKFLVCALGYAAIGMALGIFMAASKNHGQLVTHAHILLVGFVASFIYGIIHKLWLGQPRGLATAQFWIHQVSAVVMFLGLFALYGALLPESTVGPVLGASAIGVLVGALLMLYMVVRPAAQGATAS